MPGDQVHDGNWKVFLCDSLSPVPAGYVRWSAKSGYLRCGFTQHCVTAGLADIVGVVFRAFRAFNSEANWSAQGET